jgi:hypothetical protein
MNITKSFPFSIALLLAVAVTLAFGDDADPPSDQLPVLPELTFPVTTLDGILHIEGPADWIYLDFISDGIASSEDIPTALGWKDDSKLLVKVMANGNNAAADLAPALEATDFETVACSQYFCEGWLPMENYPALKARREVKDIQPIYRQAQQAGSKVSEALDSLRVDLVRANIDPTLDGRGLRIGILSDSFSKSTTAKDTYQDNINSGDLPANVNVLKEDPGNDGTDEGRAMAQLVYDLIPGASISFYTANEGSQDFANGIQALANAGCDVIVDDISTLIFICQETAKS